MPDNISCLTNDPQEDFYYIYIFCNPLGFYMIRFDTSLGVPKENDSEWKLSYWNQYMGIYYNLENVTFKKHSSTS